MYESFLAIMKDFKSSKVDTYGVIERVKTLFKGHGHLILGFNTFLPKGYEISLDEPAQAAARPAGQPVEFDQAINYVNKIKVRFQKDERVYKAFLEILNMYRKGLKTISQVYEEVALLFKAHDDLLREFTYFLPESQPPPPAGRAAKAKRAAELKRSKQEAKRAREQARAEQKRQKAQVMLVKGQLLDRVKQRLRSKDSYNDFLRCLELYSQDVLGKDDMIKLLDELLYRQPDLLAQVKELFVQAEAGEKQFDVNPTRPSIVREIAKAKLEESQYYAPISELDLTGCEACTPSYRKLPADYPEATCTGREQAPPEMQAIIAEVLNDGWVSVTSGSEDYGFKHVRWNQYEEALSRCEDDRFEMEMILECHRLALMNLENIVEEAQAGATGAAGATAALGNLHPVIQRSVTKLYGDKTPEVLKLVKLYPAKALPVVVARMKAKEAEWVDIQGHMTATWTKVYEQNYHKSLDHRSFYFKQLDKKKLGAKAMMAEVRELSAKRRQGCEGAELAELSGTLCLKGSGAPDCAFDFGDMDVHRDLGSTLALAIQHSMASEPAMKAFFFLRDFILPFLGFSEKESSDLMPELESESEEEGEGGEEGTEGRGQAESGAAAGGGSAGKGEGAPGGAGPDSGAAAAGAEDGTMNMSVDGEGEKKNQKKKNTRPPPARVLADTPVVQYDSWLGAPDAVGKRASTECLPLCMSASSREGVDVGCTDEAARHVMFANEGLYVLLRMYKTLYDRLVAARKCCRQGDVWRPSDGAARGKGGDRDGEELDQETHREFMGLLSGVVDGSVDIGSFEDDCRQLLGANSYVLYTIDKLISKLVKQVQFVLSDETTSKLLQLHRYEHSRGVGNGRSELQYWADSAALLQDDSCFRFVVNAGERRLNVHLLDGYNERLEVPAGSLDKGFSDYLQAFMQGKYRGTRKAGEGLLKDFIGRVKRKHGDRGTEGCILRNDLELKVSCASSKVSYVLETEDVFFRPSSRRKAS